MEMQLSDADRIETAMAPDAVLRPRATYESKVEQDSGRSMARGIMTAVVIAAPFWALVAFAIYLLL